jgi:hypothetical protein
MSVYDEITQAIIAELEKAVRTNRVAHGLCCTSEVRRDLGGMLVASAHHVLDSGSTYIGVSWSQPF